MSKQYQKLSALLKELFQTNQADLDFGIYRVINQRRDEINQFLDEELLPQVKEAFSEYQSVDKSHLEKRLLEAIKAAQDAGLANPEDAPRVQEIREQLANFSVDVSDLENQIYADLYNFFRRYYAEGDFVSQRRYKEGVYAIPYEGEEVKLYWANHDQYYIKTSEYFRDYSFKLPSGTKAHFKLIEADTEKDNRKEIEDKKRRFVLHEEPLDWENEEIVIRFEFRPDEDNRSQAKCNEETLDSILRLRKQISDQTQKGALAELATPTETNKERTILDKHLEDYTRRNTQDYFIHKDLGKFLRRELDFFIKNEIMHLDNIEHESVPRVEQYLSKIKVVRLIAHKIIDFLAQIEDFQKKLWLKKKFVVETNYCITLDRIPEELYPEIAANEAQREEWVRLFAIDEIKANGDMFKVSYSNPMDVEFLKANPYLTLDTKFFSRGFKLKILSFLDDVDDIDGLLVNSENFQALNLLIAKYHQAIKCIYIDPPYNAKTSEILYKNTFKHTAWLSLMESRLVQSLPLSTTDGAVIIAIDENEQENLGKLLSQIYPDHNKVCSVVVHNKKGIQGKHFSYNHEYAYFVFPDTLESTNEKPIPGEDWDYSNFRNWGGESLRTDGKNCFYPIFVKEGEITGIGDVCLDEFHPESSNVALKDGTIAVYPIDQSGIERKWRYSREGVERVKDILIVSSNRKGAPEIQKPKVKEQFKTLWDDPKYNAGDYGTRVLTHMGFPKDAFSFPKSVFTTQDSVFAISDKDSVVLDFFAGSGTTGHATINLNRADSGNRQYILVEMGKYFDTVTKPRVQKVIYSEEWKSGKPVSRKGSSQILKYILVESYEDTLNNLVLTREEDQQLALTGNSNFYENYMLHYMLDFESRDSLLNLEKFETPFDYQLEIATSTVGETTPTRIDLVETFNYLIGLHVKVIRKIDGVVVVRGTTQDERSIIVMWRTVAEMNADQLDNFFNQHIANSLDDVTDIYVNGDNNLANLRPKDQYWNVHLTEERFHKLMFEDSGV